MGACTVYLPKQEYLHYYLGENDTGGVWKLSSAATEYLRERFRLAYWALKELALQGGRVKF